MSERVREIQFANFRGLPNYSCLLRGKSIVVLGGNGKGKSGIVDGIEFLFSGKVARFHGEGTGNIDSEEAICHVQKKGEPVVAMWFTPTNDKVRRGLYQSELQVPRKSTIEAYIASQPPVESFILRRAQILNFICDQDANRYRKYIQLLGLTDIDNLQRTFVEAAQLAGDQMASARQQLRNELAVLREPTWIPITLESLLRHCSERACELGTRELANWEQLDSVISELELRRSPEIAAQVDALNRALLSLKRDLPTGLSTQVESANEIQNVLNNLKAASEEAAASSIIREGLAFFGEHKEARVCPLCERSLDQEYADLLERLKERRNAQTELRLNEERRSKLLDQLVTKIQQYADQLAKDLESEVLMTPEDVKSLRNARAALLRWLRILKRNIRDRRGGEIGIPEGLDSVSALRQRLVTGLTMRRQALIPADAAQLENAIALLNRAKTSVPRLRDAEDRAHRSVGISAAASRAKDAFSAAREKAIQLIFDQIAGKVLGYYKQLHEIDGAGEKSECTSLSLAATPRAAAGGLRLVIQFLGLDGSSDPRAFLSEGHLDSLGLCLYLATVRMFNSTGTLLVLDDVLTSIDKEHRHRVAELLFEHFADFQIVLTTHDEHWFGILQTMAHARGDQGQWRFTRISRWTLDGGPESAAFESTWSYIEANLTEGAYRELGGPLRLVLEDFIKRVAAKLEIEVKYKFDQKYTSGDFMGIDKGIREELIAKCPSDEEGIRRDVGRVFGTGDLINFLSHDNPGRLEVTLTQTTDFVSGLRALRKRCQDNKLIKGVGG